MGHLDELWAKYRDRGLVVLAVTNEGRSLVDGFIAKTGSKHPIVIEKGGDLGAEYGISGYPSSFLIDPDGKVVWSGHPAGLQDAQIEGLLGKVRLLPPLPGKLAGILKSFEKRDYAGARKGLESKLKDSSLPDEDRKAGEAAVKWIDDLGASMLASAESADRGGDPYDAAVTLRRVKDDFKGLEFADRAEESLKALTADKAKGREVSAGDLWEKTAARAKGLKPDQAAAMCRAFVKKYEGTKAAEKAEAAAARFEAAAKGK